MPVQPHRHDGRPRRAVLAHLAYLFPEVTIDAGRVADHQSWARAQRPTEALTDQSEFGLGPVPGAVGPPLVTPMVDIVAQNGKGEVRSSGGVVSVVADAFNG